MCLIERDGKVVIIDQATEIERLNAVIEELEAGLEEAINVVRRNAGTISILRARIAELEVGPVRSWKAATYCKNWSD